VSDESLRDLERRWRKSSDPADANAYLAERLRSESQLTMRLIKRLLRVELTVAAMARRQNQRVADDPTVEQILEWLDTGSIAEAPSLPVQATPSPLTLIGDWANGTGGAAAPSHATLYDDMNRGYSEAWLRITCSSCTHERGMHGPPLDARARGACLSPRCRCTLFRQEAPPAPTRPPAAPSPGRRRAAPPGRATASR
jgi:hypothetical protein